MATRSIPLAEWLITLLHDQRERVAALQGISTDEVTGWVFPNSQGRLREASNLRRDWRAFRERHNLGGLVHPYTFRRTQLLMIDGGRLRRGILLAT